MDVLDIHAGGVDLIFPHHEDEIAQSCAYTGRAEFARYWMHGEFLEVGGTKMSKRYGNILTVRDLREHGVEPGAVRLLLFGTHYRQKLELDATRRCGGAARLARAWARFATGSSARPATPTRLRSRPGRPFPGGLRRRAGRRPQRAPSDRRALRAGSGGQPAAGWGHGRRTGACRRLGAGRRVLAVAPGSRTLTVGPDALPVEQEDGIPVRPPEVPPADPQGEEAWALRWAAVRLAEKRGRNYGEADRIREVLRRAGWEIRDRRDGQIEVLRGRGSI